MLADDHILFRQGIKAVLERSDALSVIGEASDGKEAIAKVDELVPDVVLMDIAMPEVNGLEATTQIKQRHPDVRVLILTMYENEQYLQGMLHAGASGYVVKTANAEDLVSAIKAISSGYIYLYPSIARMLVNDYLKKIEEQEKLTHHEILTQREKEVLRYIAEDRKNKEIADILGISIATVQTHRTNIMEKIGAHDRTELVKYAISKGLITLP